MECVACGHTVLSPSDAFDATVEALDELTLDEVPCDSQASGSEAFHDTFHACCFVLVARWTWGCGVTAPLDCARVGWCPAFCWRCSFAIRPTKPLGVPFARQVNAAARHLGAHVLAWDLRAAGQSSTDKVSSASSAEAAEAAAAGAVASSNRRPSALVACAPLASDVDEASVRGVKGRGSSLVFFVSYFFNLFSSLSPFFHLPSYFASLRSSFFLLLWAFFPFSPSSLGFLPPSFFHTPSSFLPPSSFLFRFLPFLLPYTPSPRCSLASAPAALLLQPAPTSPASSSRRPCSRGPSSRRPTTAPGPWPPTLRRRRSTKKRSGYRRGSGEGTHRRLCLHRHRHGHRHGRRRGRRHCPPPLPSLSPSTTTAWCCACCGAA